MTTRVAVCSAVAVWIVVVRMLVYYLLTPRRNDAKRALAKINQ